MKKVTQTDIARALGISQATVGLVVGQTDSPLRQRLHPETVRRIQEKATELGYTPHKGAQMMRTGRSNLIVLLNCGGASELAARRLFHLSRLVHEAGYDFQSVDAHSWMGDPKKIVEQIISLRPEGMLMIGSFQTHFKGADVAEIQRRGIPIVPIGAGLAGAPRVRYDGRAAFRTLTQHHLRLGRRRLVVLLPGRHREPTWQVRERVEGFREALAEAGHAPPEWRDDLRCPGWSKRGDCRAAIVAVPVSLQPFAPFEPGMEGMKALLQWRTRPDGLLGINDEFAIGAMSICYRAGVSIPGEITVSGFDNLVYTTQGPVPLTSVEQPMEVICEAALEMLQKRMKGRTHPAEAEEERIFPCTIQWRESTGEPPPC